MVSKAYKFPMLRIFCNKNKFSVFTQTQKMSRLIYITNLFQNHMNHTNIVNSYGFVCNMSFKDNTHQQELILYVD
jgi:hypothetical protein